MLHCPSLAGILSANRSVVNTLRTAYGTSITIECTKGHVLYGNSLVTATCAKDGNWQPTITDCMCKYLTNVSVLIAIDMAIAWEFYIMQHN